MNFIKNNIKSIIVIAICIFGSYLTTIATNYAFDSSDIRFDNTETDLESVNVQDALDETFHHVTDYNEIKTTIGNSTLTTTNKTLTGAVNELKTDVGVLNNNITTKTDVAFISIPDYNYMGTGNSTNATFVANCKGTIVKISNLVTINLIVQFIANKSLTLSDVFIQLASAYRPSSTVRGTMSTTLTGVNAVAEVIIDSSGQIKQNHNTYLKDTSDWYGTIVFSYKTAS